MNWQTIERRYKEYKGQLRSKWGKLTDNELELARGRRNVLVGKLQQRYGIPQRAAERQLDEGVQSL